jgi:predicted AlkP superfamily pyrophosphatase or phosphodiesterase
MKRAVGLLAIVFATAVVGGAAHSGSQAPAVASAEAGHLLVILVVDQMRFEYLDRYRGLFKEGIKRLIDEGAVFDRAMYPYVNTVTCAGHATIGTGALPSTHGIVMNEWWQRDVARRMACTDDPKVKSVVYSRQPERIGHSAHRLRVPTLGDRLRRSTPNARVVTLSMKPRSTIMLAGHGGTAVTWFGASNTWATSTAFTSELVPEVKAYVDAHPIDRLRGEVWNRANDPASYSGKDDAVGERGPSGWTPQFPHPLAGKPGTPEERFYDLWERSPYSDAMLGDMASTLVKTMQLGKRGVVDLLGVSFSAVDYVGHDFGPQSHELQDTLIRLDRTLGLLLATLDQTLGRDGYTLGLSADHGVGEIPEATSASGRDAGRLLNAETRKIAEDAMIAAHGPGEYVAHVEYTELYLTPNARIRAARNMSFLKPMIDALSEHRGVLRVMPTAGLEKKRASSDPIERAAALGYVPGQSGDVEVLLKPDWINSDTSAATHGSLHPYDQHVPVIFFGGGIKKGRYSDPASPADLAPTLASIVKLPMPGVDGKVLRNAVRSPAP